MTTACPLELLQSALAGTLSLCDEVLLHRHLEVCEECSAALEQMAGGASWCHEAAAMVTHDELDGALATGNECSEADFAVEFLEPARARGTRSVGRLRRAEDYRSRRHGSGPACQSVWPIRMVCTEAAG